MPRLINYLNHLTPARSYDEAQLAALQRVYDRARDALGIGMTDARRERVALLVFELSETASGDALLANVIAAFRETG